MDKDNYTFNANDKPEYYFDQEWNSPSGVWELTSSSYAARYHYEPYTTSGVEQIADFGGNATLFPVPASSQTTIDIRWEEPQAFTVSVTDMQGRLHTSWNVQSTKQYHETISLTDLPAGNYMVTLQGQKGKISKQLSVVK
jgi:hypothetical protein